MAYFCKAITENLDVLEKIGSDVYFDSSIKSSYSKFEHQSLSFQAANRSIARNIMQVFPQAIWQKEWIPKLNWWTFTASFPKMKLDVLIYACPDPGNGCKAIYETHIVDVEVPVTFKTVQEEQKIFVKWDCKNGEEAGEEKVGEEKDVQF